ncbi:hypothetical protein FSARC_11961 [Fusarium sarcochroum]|uniref:Chromo domain-containing protein n=1 Tax=Fusarium sarcochroum TaxID=1208366 RepID=A0A8H4TBV6_9HYPO|nr:hypothetical protein FSARC_11961 [Fusarium sarcochroum]
MPAPKPTPTVFYARDKSPLEDLKGPRRSVEDEEPLLNVVSDIVDQDSHDEEYGTPPSVHTRESTAPEKRFVSPDEEDSGDASSQTMKPPAKRQRRTRITDGATPRRSGRISSATPAIKEEKPSVFKAPIKRGRGRPPTKAKMTPKSQVEEPLAVKSATKRGRGRPPAEPKTTRRASEAEWEVEKVLGSQIDAETNKHFYLVKWKGFTNKENTWEPKKNLGNCRKLIQDFENIKH